MSETSIGTSFSCPVADFPSNAQGLVVVIYCLLVFAEEAISTSEISIGKSFSCPVADFLGNAQGLVLVI